MTMRVPLETIQDIYARLPDGGHFTKYLTKYNSEIVFIPLLRVRHYKEYLTVRKFRKAIKDKEPTDYESGMYYISLYPKIVDGTRIVKIGDVKDFTMEMVEFE
jgi:hypothetical protein